MERSDLWQGPLHGDERFDLECRSVITLTLGGMSQMRRR